jgi:putative phosphoesterase
MSHGIPDGASGTGLVHERAAIITDIHGNLPALEAALARIDELGIEAIYCGGDLVGYGPRPNDVCALIQERAIPTIYGNYDHAIARDEHDCGCAYVTAHDRDVGQRSVEWTLVHTDGPAKDFMRGLPFDVRFRIGDRGVHLVHGSPRKVNEYLFEDKPASLYERLAAAETDAALAFGHTHKPWVHDFGGVRFVNCGSVGKPKDGDPRAAFAVLETANPGIRVTIERVAYDAEPVAAEIRASGLPEELADKLLTAT